MWKTHLLFGLVLGLLLMHYFNFNYWLVFVVMISALLPDLDTPFSWLGRKLKPVSNIISFIFGHRGMMHSLLFMVVITTVGYLYLRSYWMGIAIGFFSHLVLDMMNVMGVRLLWPLDFKVRGFLRANGLFEKLFFILLIIIAVGLIYKTAL